MPLRETAQKLSPEQYEQNFADITPAMNARQAAVEASRCLYCFDAPCIQACPTRIDGPGFIKRIMTGNVRGAARVILDANILGESCGRVCPTEVLCEGACVMVENGERAIEIGGCSNLPRTTCWIARFIYSMRARRMGGAWPASVRGSHPWRARRKLRARVTT